MLKHLYFSGAIKSQSKATPRTQKKHLTSKNTIDYQYRFLKCEEINSTGIAQSVLLWHKRINFIQKLYDRVENYFSTKLKQQT